jgi:hypothetical protein
MPSSTKPTSTKPHSTKPRSTKPRSNAPQPAKPSSDALLASVAFGAPPADAAAGDPVPQDAAVFRLALARRMLTFLGLPRRCHEPVCRRLKRCAGPTMRCQRDFPAPPSTPEQDANNKAVLRRALDKRLLAGS